MDVFSLASVAVAMIRRVRRTDVIPTANSAIFSQPQISKATDPRSNTCCFALSDSNVLLQRNMLLIVKLCTQVFLVGKFYAAKYLLHKFPNECTQELFLASKMVM